MRLDRAFSKLKPGDPAFVSPGGWVRRYMEEDARNGWLNTCEKMSRSGLMQYDANSKFEVPYLLPPWKWLGNARDGWDKSVPFYQPLIDQMGAYGEGEYQGHWLDELYRMAFVVKLEGFAKRADKTVADILAEKENPWKGAFDYGLYRGPDESGYIGTNPPYLRFTGKYQAPVGILSGSFEASGMSEVLSALMLYHKYTKKEEVLKAVEKCADLICEKMAGKETMGASGGPLMASMLAKLYQCVPKREYLELAVTINDHFSLPIDERLKTGGFGMKGIHTATIGIIMLANQDLYEATGDERFLSFSERMFRNVAEYGMQPHGSGTASHELLDCSGPDKNTEGCDTAWFVMAWTQLVKITGKAYYADLAERALYNALPGHRSKDGLANPYYTRPNQLFAVRSDGQGTVMAARLIVECCMGNLGRCFPYLIENAVLTENDCLYVPFYTEGSYRVKIKDRAVDVEIKTEYPFEETVCIKLETGISEPFPVKFRIPSWCTEYSAAVGKKAAAVSGSDGWCELVGDWKNTPDIELTFKMPVYLEKQGEYVSVFRGPLLYALPVDGERTVVDKWGSFEELPDRRSKWNYALIIDEHNPGDSIKYTKCETGGGAYVWDRPRGVLSVKAARLPDWKFDRSVAELIPKNSTDAPEPEFKKEYLNNTEPPEIVNLVPYGNTVLRMACLPHMNCN